MTEYLFDRRLTVDTLTEISEGRRTPVVAEGLIARVAGASEAAERIASRRKVYGRSTGVGANRLTAAIPDTTAHGMNLIRSHACDAGDPIRPEVVRATLAVRLNQLLQGRAGIAPEVVEALADMLRKDALPELREFGSIGTADLQALAGIALALVGERPTTRDFARLGTMGADSALPFISSSALTIAQTSLAADRLSRLIRTQHVVFALSAAAARANTEAIAPAVARTIGIEAAHGIAAGLERALGRDPWEPARIQDPYAFRGYLQTASLLELANARLRDHLETLMNLGQENPLFVAEEEQAYHHGSFYQAALSHELDSVAIALAQHAPLLVSRLRFLDDDAFSGLPRFLAPELGGSSGTMMVEYLAASALGDILGAAAPASIHTTVLSCGVEDDASFAATGARKLERALDAFELMLACELLVAVRGARLRGLSESSGLLGEALALASALPEGTSDRDLRDDVETATGLLPGIAVLFQES